MENLNQLSQKLEGEFFSDHLMKVLYATDASVYRELPLAVAYPKNKEDIKLLIDFARKEGTSLIARTAGTSLAGQCVGNGIVVDVAKYMNKILEINSEEQWVRVQPGVIRDELNVFLKPYGLFFGPNTSTANRCMMGGMVGNNSCGSTSIKYGTTRDHTMELETILSDGSEVSFSSLSKETLAEKSKLSSLEGAVYRQIQQSLSKPDIQNSIRSEFPKAGIHRRNTGYAVDFLLESNVFNKKGGDFNFCELLAGSEGTLAFTTEIKLHVDKLPPKEEVLVCVHFNDIHEAMNATLVAMKHAPYACELMDKILLELTKGNRKQKKNRFFVEGDPGAILVIEIRAEEKEEMERLAELLIQDLKSANLGYAFPKVYPPKTSNVWELRAAGLGLLSNMPGDAKPVACIEDTAVDLPDLPAYISEFEKMMEGFGQQAVYYAHAGAGELHLRPILNLKEKEGVQKFYDISHSSARLVKKYKGSLSGEHGDGRLRAAFIPEMIGEKNYQLLKEIKNTWDPQHIFNPGKIVDAPPMDSFLRYEADQGTPDLDSVFNYSEVGGLMRAAEKCSGSGDCRKLPLSGGTMCPSYQATRNEKDTTRGRANALREYLTQNASEANPFAHPDLYRVMELCLSCKACSSECPSNVDMATLKTEFLHHYYKKYGVPLRTKAIANISNLNKLGALVPGLTNFFMKNGLTSSILKKTLKIAPKRSMPLLEKTTLKKWYARNKKSLKPYGAQKGSLYFFCDEFTNYNDVSIGIKLILLLNKLGYQVDLIDHPDSGRAHFSKGMLTQAQKLAKANVTLFKNLISENKPLVGLEPSAILGFRDEYPRLVEKEDIEAAKKLGGNALIIEEFLYREMQKGNITSAQFTKEKKHILLHGHCHQKSLSSADYSAWILGLPENYEVEIIPSGCCGMAGSFGYEKEHYEVSMQVGELVLLPAIRKAKDDTTISAPGTSCRHQILDGTGKKALHPVEVLWEAILSPVR
ncbi:MAG: FAD-binding protein [Bacteroidetes bacterium]|nr:FAD-binding protein [Bacteroidota bacterium]